MKKPIIFLIGACVLCAILLSAIGIWKLQHLQYNALDLGIYTQVIWNIGHGNSMASSIQNTNYLGDHVEPLLYPLSFLIGEGPIPYLLVIIQAIWLMLAAIPLFYVSRAYLSEKLSLMVACAYLINPLIWNMGMFEFHMLTLAIPLLLFAILAYIRKNYWQFLTYTILAMFVREDVALILIGFGILALIERRKIKWWLAPIGLGIGWFIVASRIINWANPDGYKFSTYYAWLGGSFSEIVHTIVTRPLFVLQNLISFGDLLMLLAFILIWLGLPLKGLKMLIPVIFIFLQLILPQFDVQIVLETHYTALLVPFLFWAAVVGLSRYLKTEQKFLIALQTTYQPLTGIIATVVLVYTFLFLGPIVGSVSAITSTPPNSGIHSLMRQIPDNASVYASYGALPYLATRENVFTFHYAALGKKQFSNLPYITEPKPSYTIVDLKDFDLLELQNADSAEKKAQYETSYLRMQLILNDYAITGQSSTTLLLQEKSSESAGAADFLAQKTTDFFATNNPKRLGPVSVLSATQESKATQSQWLRLEFEVNQEDRETQQLYYLTLENSAGNHITVPFGWTLVPIHALQVGEGMTMRVPVPENFLNAKKLLVRLGTRTGYLHLNGLRSAEPVFTPKELSSVEMDVAPAL